MSGIQIGQLNSVLSQLLSECTEDIKRDIDQECENEARETAKELQANSPKKRGKYAKGWRYKKEDGVWVVYNAKHPRLTYLLERGHAIRNGGRTRAMTHIEPEREKAELRLLRRLNEKYGG